jgi:hypothetical protein
VPDIREPVPTPLGAKADFDDPDADPLDIADGGRAVVEDAVDAVDAVLEPRNFAETDFTGE